MQSADIEKLILRTVERWWAGRYSERHGLVTSYDPDKYLAKVMFQPEQQESGWLPIETGHIGNGYGIAIGLTPGDGKSTGDQVIVRYQEGDFESGKIVQRVHSDQEKPPFIFDTENIDPVLLKPKNNAKPRGIASGEMVLYAYKKQQNQQQQPQSSDNTQQPPPPSGPLIFWQNDNSLIIQDGNGAYLKFDGQGNIILASKTKKITITNGDFDTTVQQGHYDLTIQQGGGDGTTTSNDAGCITVNLDKDYALTAGGKFTETVAKNYVITTQQNYTLTAQQAVNITSVSQDTTITATATAINLVPGDKVYLGGIHGGVPAAKLGTEDDGGYKDQRNLANKVNVV